MILTGWLLHSIRLVAALGTALLLMQAPAVTREYQAALLQLVRSSDQEIAERKASDRGTGDVRWHLRPSPADVGLVPWPDVERSTS